MSLFKVFNSRGTKFRIIPKDPQLVEAAEPVNSKIEKNRSAPLLYNLTKDDIKTYREKIKEILANKELNKQNEKIENEEIARLINPLKPDNNTEFQKSISALAYALFYSNDGLKLPYIWRLIFDKNDFNKDSHFKQNTQDYYENLRKLCNTIEAEYKKLNLIQGDGTTNTQNGYDCIILYNITLAKNYIARINKLQDTSNSNISNNNVLAKDQNLKAEISDKNNEIKNELVDVMQCIHRMLNIVNGSGIDLPWQDRFNRTPALPAEAFSDIIANNAGLLEKEISDNSSNDILMNQLLAVGLGALAVIDKHSEKGVSTLVEQEVGVLKQYVLFLLKEYKETTDNKLHPAEIQLLKKFFKIKRGGILHKATRIVLNTRSYKELIEVLDRDEKEPKSKYSIKGKNQSQVQEVVHNAQNDIGKEVRNETDKFKDSGKSIIVVNAEIEEKLKAYLGIFKSSSLTPEVDVEVIPKTRNDRFNDLYAYIDNLSPQFKQTMLPKMMFEINGFRGSLLSHIYMSSNISLENFDDLSHKGTNHYVKLGNLVNNYSFLYDYDLTYSGKIDFEGKDFISLDNNKIHSQKQQVTSINDINYICINDENNKAHYLEHVGNGKYKIITLKGEYKECSPQGIKDLLDEKLPSQVFENCLPHNQELEYLDFLYKIKNYTVDKDKALIDFQNWVWDIQMNKKMTLTQKRELLGYLRQELELGRGGIFAKTKVKRNTPFNWLFAIISYECISLKDDFPHTSLTSGLISNTIAPVGRAALRAFFDSANYGATTTYLSLVQLADRALGNHKSQTIPLSVAHHMVGSRLLTEQRSSVNKNISDSMDGSRQAEPKKKVDNEEKGFNLKPKPLPLQEGLFTKDSTITENVNSIKEALHENNLNKLEKIIGKLDKQSETDRHLAYIILTWKVNKDLKPEKTIGGATNDFLLNIIFKKFQTNQQAKERILKPLAEIWKKAVVTQLEENEGIKFQDKDAENSSMGEVKRQDENSKSNLNEKFMDMPGFRSYLAKVGEEIKTRDNPNYALLKLYEVLAVIGLDSTHSKDDKEDMENLRLKLNYLASVIKNAKQDRTSSWNVLRKLNPTTELQIKVGLSFLNDILCGIIVFMMVALPVSFLAAIPVILITCLLRSLIGGYIDNISHANTDQYKQALKLINPNLRQELSNKVNSDSIHKRQGFRPAVNDTGIKLDPQQHLNKKVQEEEQKIKRSIISPHVKQIIKGHFNENGEWAISGKDTRNKDSKKNNSINNEKRSNEELYDYLNDSLSKTEFYKDDKEYINAINAVLADAEVEEDINGRKIDNSNLREDNGVPSKIKRAINILVTAKNAFNEEIVDKCSANHNVFRICRIIMLSNFKPEIKLKILLHYGYLYKYRLTPESQITSVERDHEREHLAGDAACGLIYGVASLAPMPPLGLHGGYKNLFSTGWSVFGKLAFFGLNFNMGAHSNTKSYQAHMKLIKYFALVCTRDYINRLQKDNMIANYDESLLKEVKAFTGIKTGRASWYRIFRSNFWGKAKSTKEFKKIKKLINAFEKIKELWAI